MPVEVVPLHGGVLDRSSEADPSGVDTDLLVIPFWEDERPLQGLAGWLDWRWGGRLSGYIRETFAVGARDECVLMPADHRVAARRVLLAGLGPSHGFDEARARQSAARLMRVLAGLQPDTVTVPLPTVYAPQAASEAMLLALHAAQEEIDARLMLRVLVAEKNVARMRRLLEGPPRAAAEQ